MSDNARALLSVADGIATVTLNRTDRMNTIDLAMAQRLREIGHALAARDDLRVVVVKGAGPAFCAGGDIDVFAANLDNMTPVVNELLGAYHGFLQFLADTEALVVTSVHGAAAGAGLSLAFMGDFCIAADTAVFTPAYGKLGVSPDGGGTVGLVRAVGPRRAMQVFLAEDSIPAAKAEAWGLVTKVVPLAAIAEETDAFVRRLARNTPTAARATKRLIRQSADMAPAAQLDAELRNMAACMATDDFRAAVLRFIKK